MRCEIRRGWNTLNDIREETKLTDWHMYAWRAFEGTLDDEQHQLTTRNGCCMLKLNDIENIEGCLGGAVHSSDHWIKCDNLCNVQLQGRRVRLPLSTRGSSPSIIRSTLRPSVCPSIWAVLWHPNREFLRTVVIFSFPLPLLAKYIYTHPHWITTYHPPTYQDGGGMDGRLLCFHNHSGSCTKSIYTPTSIP